MLETLPYLDQRETWPQSGRHVVAHFDDDDTIVVYQAYTPSIGRFAIDHGYFGGPDFSFDRMSWIKPSFLWMMYRSGWASKLGQETVLAIRLYRWWFDSTLRSGVPSSFDESGFSSYDSWKEAVRQSDVRVQWDPDRDPRGGALERRALQVGLRGRVLSDFRGPAIASIEDITDLAIDQRRVAESLSWSSLSTPTERVYHVDDTGES